MVRKRRTFARNLSLFSRSLKDRRTARKGTFLDHSSGSTTERQCHYDSQRRGQPVVREEGLHLIATIRCKRSGTARKGRETQGKAVKREDRCLHLGLQPAGQLRPACFGAAAAALGLGGELGAELGCSGRASTRLS
eukprot:SAG22_NODE_181_length_16048_cov_157.464418_14_plen_136_part_00